VKISQHRLELSLCCESVAALKERYSCWRDPEQLCKELGIRVEYGGIGFGRKGATFTDAIKLVPTAGVPDRRTFTFYHEIIHCEL
jgi:hypothetical protein